MATDWSGMERSAGAAADFLRSLANEKRLMIVCNLVEGEKNVGELCAAIGARQSTVSQQLALLRRDGIVEARRDAQTIYYRLADDGARQIMELLHAMFCRPDDTRMTSNAKSALV